jgi:hypothetical protein
MIILILKQHVKLFKNTFKSPVLAMLLLLRTNLLIKFIYDPVNFYESTILTSQHSLNKLLTNKAPSSESN